MFVSLSLSAGYFTALRLAYCSSENSISRSSTGNGCANNVVVITSKCIKLL